MQQAKLLLEASRFVDSFSTVTKINFCARKTGWVEESCQGINSLSDDHCWCKFYLSRTENCWTGLTQTFISTWSSFLINREAVKKLKSVFLCTERAFKRLFFISWKWNKTSHEMWFFDWWYNIIWYFFV